MSATTDCLLCVPLFRLCNDSPRALEMFCSFLLLSLLSICSFLCAEMCSCHAITINELNHDEGVWLEFVAEWCLFIFLVCSLEKCQADGQSWKRWWPRYGGSFWAFFFQDEVDVDLPLEILRDCTTHKYGGPDGWHKAVGHTWGGKTLQLLGLWSKFYDVVTFEQTQAETHRRKTIYLCYLRW